MILINQLKVTSKFNGNSHLLNIDSLCFKAGINIVFGENGSGKTSLLKTMMGLIPNYYNFEKTGNVVFSDKILNYDQNTHILKSSIYASQNFIDLDFQHSFLYNCKQLECSSKFNEKIYHFILDELKNHAFQYLINRDIELLSEGEKRFLYFLYKLCTANIKLFLLDEPLIHLDDVKKKIFLNVLKQFDLCANNIGFILTESNINNINFYNKIIGININIETVNSKNKKYDHPINLDKKINDSDLKNILNETPQNKIQSISKENIKNVLHQDGESSIIRNEKINNLSDQLQDSQQSNNCLDNKKKIISFQAYKHHYTNLKLSGNDLKLGQIYCLKANSGEGKSHFLRDLFDDIKVHSSRVFQLKEVFFKRNSNFKNFKLNHEFKNNIKYLPQNVECFSLCADVFEEIELESQNSEQVRQIINECFFQLSPYKSNINQYSFAQQKIIFLISQLLSSTLILLWDEPFSGISIENITLLKAMIQIMKMNKIIVYSCHKSYQFKDEKFFK